MSLVRGVMLQRYKDAGSRPHHVDLAGGRRLAHGLGRAHPPREGPDALVGKRGQAGERAGRVSEGSEVSGGGDGWLKEEDVEMIFPTPQRTLKAGASEGRRRTPRAPPQSTGGAWGGSSSPHPSFRGGGSDRSSVDRSRWVGVHRSGGGHVTVIPDGCRDLILHIPARGRPSCLSRARSGGCGSCRRGRGPVSGYRLRPGWRGGRAADLGASGTGAWGRAVLERLGGARCSIRRWRRRWIAWPRACRSPWRRGSRGDARTLQRHVRRPPARRRLLAAAGAGAAGRAGGAGRRGAGRDGAGARLCGSSHMARAFRRWLGGEPAGAGGGDAASGAAARCGLWL
jgi:hypothetical protein